MGRKSELFNVYRLIESHLMPGLKISIKQVWSLCHTREGCFYVGSIHYQTVVRHLTHIMNILIDRNYALKLKRG